MLHLTSIKKRGTIAIMAVPLAVTIALMVTAFMLPFAAYANDSAGLAVEGNAIESLTPQSVSPQGAISLSKAKVASIAIQPFSGKAINPSPKVTLSGKTLRKGTDYTLSYCNSKGKAISAANVKAPGAYYVVAKGKGNYTGSVRHAFKIVAPTVTYRTHVQNIGWQRYVKNGAVAGTTGCSLRLEATNIKLASKPTSGSIQYRTHIQNIGWESGWKSDGAMSGTSGRSLRLEAIQIRLTGNMAKKYDVYYRVHCQNIGWMGWAKNGASAGSAGYAYRLEAMQIKLIPKGAKAPGSTANAFRQKQYARVGVYNYTEGDVKSWGISNKPIKGIATDLSAVVLKVSGRYVTLRFDQIYLYGVGGYYQGNSKRLTVKLDSNNAASFSFRTYCGDSGTGRIRFLPGGKATLLLKTTKAGYGRMPLGTGGKTKTLTWKRGLTSMDTKY